jgi:hypothetical protein
VLAFIAVLGSPLLPAEVTTRLQLVSQPGSNKGRNDQNIGTQGKG